jgi:hypothetical protein
MYLLRWVHIGLTDVQVSRTTALLERAAQLGVTWFPMQHSQGHLLSPAVIHILLTSHSLGPAQAFSGWLAVVLQSVEMKRNALLILDLFNNDSSTAYGNKTESSSVSNVNY